MYYALWPSLQRCFKSMEEFLKAYGDELARKLQRNDKATINALSMLAEAQKEFAGGIVGVIEQHILTCPPPAKLPALYLVDSILKNVREPYVSLFARRIAEVFGAVWDITLQDRRPSLSRLYGTWDKVFPSAVLSQVASRMVSTSNGRQQSALPPVLQAAPLTQQQPSFVPQQQPLVQQQGMQTTYAVSAGPSMQVVAQPQQQYIGLQQPYTGMQPAGVGLTYMQLPTGQLVQVALPQPGLQQQTVVQHNTPTYQQHSTPTYQQHKTPQHVMQVQGSQLPPVSPGHATVSHQQQQPQAAVAVGPGGGPMVRRSPSSPGAAVSDPVHGPPPPPPPHSRSRRTPSPAPNSGDLAGEALTQLLSNLASRGVLAQKDSQEAALKTTEFQPAFLKELHSGVLEELQQLSAKSASKFRDVEFQRNKRKAAASSAAVSRSWYLPVDTWIAGTTAPEEFLAANPFEDEEASDSDQEQASAVEPEDPDQTTCAISGEPFEKFFDQQQEGWFYQGVRRLTGDEAVRYGVADGALVKVECLAEAGLGSGAAAMAAAGTVMGEQQQEALMAAAAAEAPAAGGADAEPNSPAQQQQQQVDETSDKHPIVKMEAVQAAGQVMGSPAETNGPVAAAAAASHPSSKREGSIDAAGDEGTPAKRAKLEQ